MLKPSQVSLYLVSPSVMNAILEWMQRPSFLFLGLLVPAADLVNLAMLARGAHGRFLALGWGYIFPFGLVRAVINSVPFLALALIAKKQLSNGEALLAVLPRGRVRVALVSGAAALLICNLYVVSMLLVPPYRNPWKVIGITYLIFHELFFTLETYAVGWVAGSFRSLRNLLGCLATICAACVANYSWRYYREASSKTQYQRTLLNNMHYTVPPESPESNVTDKAKTLLK